MASSIPFLRLFWKEIHAKTSSRSRSKSGYVQEYKMDHMNSYAKMDSRNAASGIRTHVRAEPSSRVDKSHIDDDSDKSILAPSRNMNQIMRTDEIRVEHGSAKDMVGHKTYEVV